MRIFFVDSEGMKEIKISNFELKILNAIRLSQEEYGTNFLTIDRKTGHIRCRAFFFDVIHVYNGEQMGQNDSWMRVDVGTTGLPQY